MELTVSFASHGQPQNQYWGIAGVWMVVGHVYVWAPNRALDEVKKKGKKIHSPTRNQFEAASFSQRACCSQAAQVSHEGPRPHSPHGISVTASLRPTSASSEARAYIHGNKKKGNASLRAVRTQDGPPARETNDFVHSNVSRGRVASRAIVSHPTTPARAG